MGDSTDAVGQPKANRSAGIHPVTKKGGGSMSPALTALWFSQQIGDVPQYLGAVQRQPQQLVAAFSPHPNPSPRWGEGLSGKLCELFLNPSLVAHRSSVIRLRPYLDPLGPVVSNRFPISTCRWSDLAQRLVLADCRPSAPLRSRRSANTSPKVR